LKKNFYAIRLIMFGRHPYQTQWNYYSTDDENIVIDTLKKTKII